jgi:hypothetical protein
LAHFSSTNSILKANLFTKWLSFFMAYHTLRFTNS